MPYKVGAKGSYGCSGYPAVKEGGEVMGCHKTRAEAAGQIYAINRSEGNIGKAATMLSEGDYAMTQHGGEGDFHIGQVVHIMTEGALGNPETEYYMEATPENPAAMIQLFEQEEDGYWEATRLYTACAMSLYVKIDPLQTEPEMNSEMSMAMYDASLGKSDDSYISDDEEMDKWSNIEKKCWVGYTQQGMKEKDGRMVPNCVPVNKSDSVDKAEKPNYGAMIKPRRGGSNPSDPKLYARVVQAAKDKFDVYPSAVANAWVVQEYKRRGGTYKSDAVAKGSVWGGSLFDPKGFRK